MGNFEFTLQVTYFLDIYVCLLFFGSLRLLLMLKSVKLLAFIPWGPWAATADFMKCRVTSLNLLKTSIRQMILAKLCNRFIWCLHLCTHYLNSECFFFFFFFCKRRNIFPSQSRICIISVDELLCVWDVTQHSQAETHLARASTEWCMDGIHREVAGTNTSHIVKHSNLEGWHKHRQLITKNASA